MSRQIDYRSASQFPADDVYAVMVDPDFLRARLVQMGGPGAVLLEHHPDGDGCTYRLRHGLDARNLPAVVRSVLPGDIVIERTEQWKREGPGRYAGTVDVLIRGTPATAAGGQRLRDLDTGGSELLVRADVTVNVPLIGGRIESVIAEQVQSLLASETAFTLDWLRKAG